MAEIVTIAVGGGRWTAFESISVQASVKHAARSFSLEIAAENDGGAAAKLMPNSATRVFQVFAPVQIFAGGSKIFDGHVDSRRAKLTAERGALTIEGRAKGADAVDSAAMHKTGRFEQKSPLDIAQELDKHGINFSASAQLQKIKEFQLTPGETLFRTVERLARDQQATLRGMADGSIDFWNAKTTQARHAGALIEGVNIEEIEVDHNGANRHSHVHVRGQKYDGHGAQNLRIESVATDDDVPRYRPQIIAADGDTDKDRSKTRARHHRDRKAGNGLTAQILVPVWRDEGGALWEPGHRVFVQSPFADIAQDMILETVTFMQTAERTSAKLGLVDPRAHGGQKGGVNKSGKAWAQPDTEAE